METNFDFCAELANHLIRECKNDCERKCLLKSCADFHYEVNRWIICWIRTSEIWRGLSPFWRIRWAGSSPAVRTGRPSSRTKTSHSVVCLIAANTQKAISPLFCDCSTFYAQKMFAKVCGQEVKASLKRSVLRDGKSCIYEITLC